MESFLVLYASVPGSDDLDISAVLAPLTKSHSSTIRSQVDAAMTTLLRFADRDGKKEQASSLLRAFSKRLFDYIRIPDNDKTAIMGCKGLWILIGQLILKIPEVAGDFVTWFTNADGCKALLVTEPFMGLFTVRKLFNLLLVYTKAVFSKEVIAIGTPKSLVERGSLLHLPAMASYLQAFINKFMKADLTTSSVQDRDKTAFASCLQMIIQLCAAHGPNFIEKLQFPVETPSYKADLSHGCMLLHLCVRREDFRAYLQSNECYYSYLLNFLYPESSPVLFMLVEDAEKLIQTPNVDWSSKYYLRLFETIITIDSFGASGLLTKLPQRLFPLVKPLYGKALSCTIERLLRSRKTYSKTFWKLVEVQLTCFNIFPADSVLLDMQRSILKHGKASIFIGRMLRSIEHKSLSKQELAKVVMLYALFLTEGDAPTAGIVKLKVNELIRDFPTILRDVLSGNLYTRVCLRSNICIDRQLFQDFFLSILSLSPGEECVKDCTFDLFIDLIRTCISANYYYADFYGASSATNAPALHLQSLLVAINNTFGTNMGHKEYALLFKFFFSGADGPNAELVLAQLKPLIEKYLSLLTETLRAEMLGSESREFGTISVLHFLFVQGGLDFFISSTKEASCQENIISKFHINQVVTLQSLLLLSCLFSHLPESYLNKICIKFVDECIDTCNLGSIIVVANKALFLYSLLLSTDTSSVEIPRRIGQMFGCFIKYCYATYQVLENEDLIGLIVCLTDLSILCKNSRSLLLFAGNVLENIIELDAQHAITDAGKRITQLLNYIFQGANTNTEGKNSLLTVSYILSPIKKEAQKTRPPMSPNPMEGGSSSSQKIFSPNGTSILVDDVSIKRQPRGVASPAYRMLWLYIPFFLELLDALASVFDIAISMTPLCLYVPMGWVSFGINRPSELHSSDFSALLAEEIYIPVMDHYGIKQHDLLHITRLVQEVPNNNCIYNVAKDSLKSLQFPAVSMFSVNTILPYSISPSRYDYSMAQRFHVHNANLSMLLSTYPMSYIKRLFGCINFWTAFINTDPSEAMRQLATVPFFVTTLNCKSTVENIRGLYSTLINTLEPKLPLLMKQRFSALLHDMAMLLFDRYRLVPDAFSHKRRSYGIINGLLCFCQCTMLSSFVDYVSDFIFKFLTNPKYFDSIACYENSVSYIHLAESFYLSLLAKDGKATMSTISYNIGSIGIVAAIENMNNSNWEMHNAWMSLYGTIAKSTFYNTHLDRKKLLERLSSASLKRIGDILEKLIYSKETTAYSIQQTLCAGLIYAHVRDVQNDDLRLFKSIIHLLFSPCISLRALAGKIFAAQFDGLVEQIVTEVLCWLRTAEFVSEMDPSKQSEENYEDKRICFNLSMLPSIKGSPLSRRICSLIESQYNRQKHVFPLLESLSFMLYHADCSGNELCYGVLDLLQRLKVSEIDTLLIRSRAYSLNIRD